jgi:hypothetical protein
MSNTVTDLDNRIQVRAPTWLVDALAQEAHARALSFSAFVRVVLVSELRDSGTDVPAGVARPSKSRKSRRFNGR